MTTTFYDRRAERITAQAQAEQQRAAAEQTRAQTALTLVQVEQARLAGAVELAEQRRQREQAERQATRERRAVTRARLAGRVPVWLLSVLWATVIVAPITLAWQAQRAFAESTLHIGSTWSWLFPLAVEAGAWVCAFEAHRRAKTGLPVGALPTWMWVLASIAAGINLLHGAVDYGPVAGVALGLVSLLGVLLHHIRQNVDKATAEGRDNTALRRALWRRLRFPRLAWAAASITLACGDTVTADEAWRRAWVDRFGVGPDAPRRERRLAHRVLRYEAAQDRHAAKEGRLVILGGRVQRAYTEQIRALIDAERAAATERAEQVLREANDVLGAAAMVFGPDALRDGTAPSQNGGYTGREQGELSGRPAELLTMVRGAIAAGELPQYPSVKAIARRFEGFGTPTIQRVRDALRMGHIPITDTTETMSERRAA
ncbi:hypothetical protein JOF56_001869 [Kibdelosporangium banguiense]|uniref:DUF2637 domain-containing protein n=1 Tax=Kibdelosporangium banguiense TaxID=1365924 RepID=A0ABS4TAX9_9PSEU|nr:DUF2637 domain-containing protein [Kibdelosporangium banguiense]MBP2321484.1 hypothetical protein [Kibdelosporangium banguiense]